MEQRDPPADLRDLLERTIAEFDDCVHLLTRHFPAPQLVRLGRGPAARHVEGQTDLLAAHLKCIRAAAALNSALVLLDHGQIQDVYALCRIVGSSGHPGGDETYVSRLMREGAS